MVESSSRRSNYLNRRRYRAGVGMGRSRMTAAGSRLHQFQESNGDQSSVRDADSRDAKTAAGFSCATKRGDRSWKRVGSCHHGGPSRRLAGQRFDAARRRVEQKGKRAGRREAQEGATRQRDAAVRERMVVAAKQRRGVAIDLM